MPHRWAHALLITLLAAAGLLAAAPVSGAFADTTLRYYFHDETGDVHGNATGVALMDTIAPSGAAQDRIIAAGQRASWYLASVWSEDRIVTGAAAATLYVAPTPLTQGHIWLRLYDVAPDSTATLLGEQRQDYTGSTTSLAYAFPAVQGAILPAGHALRATAQAGPLSAPILIKYDGAAAPSGLTAFTIRILDSDGDGLADTTERQLSTDPFDADSDDDGHTDGAEVSAGTDPLDAADPAPAGGDGGSGDGGAGDGGSGDGGSGGDGSGDGGAGDGGAGDGGAGDGGAGAGDGGAGGGGSGDGGSGDGGAGDGGAGDGGSGDSGAGDGGSGDGSAGDGNVGDGGSGGAGSGDGGTDDAAAGGGQGGGQTTLTGSPSPKDEEEAPAPFLEITVGSLLFAAILTMALAGLRRRDAL